ncbi:MAG: 4-hydroxythreonine-4-phosphate dehydrogenase PdxA [Planktomarina sp.]
MPMPPLAVTCGDPAGIGLEITLKAFRSFGRQVPFVWFGDTGHLPDDLDYHHWTPGTPADLAKFNVFHVPFAQSATLGHGTPANAQGVVDTIVQAVEMALAGHISGLCTAPIHKALLQDGANFAFPGHTEFLAHLSDVSDVVMMLASDMLRVVPLTIHIPISEVPSAINQTGFKSTAQIMERSLKQEFGIAHPRIWVAGLNPHASEGGKIGREDIDIIAPWIAELHDAGMDIQGPFSADTMFHSAARAKYDAALCMYHDQALIPIKTLDFSGGVNVTLGLPFVRTSPDHGTAFDIAGRGIADETSMIAALRMAQEMAKARHNAN